jgi:hypothetical protein
LSPFHHKATAARGVEFEYARACEYHIGSFNVIVTTGSASGRRTSPLSLFVGSATAGEVLTPGRGLPLGGLGFPLIERQVEFPSLSVARCRGNSEYSILSHRK